MGHRIDVGELQLFNRISKEGSRRVAESLTQLTGLEAGIAVSKITFLDLEDLKTHVGDATEVGIHVELTEPPHGYVLFLLDSRVVAGESDVDLTVSTFPELADLVDLVGRMDLDTDVATDTVADPSVTD